MKPSRSAGADEVEAAGDRRVRVYGTVVSLEEAEGKLVLDDGGTSIEVFLNNPAVRERLEDYQPGDQLMVIGRGTDSGMEGEIIRRIAGYEPSRYKQVTEVWRNVQGKND